MREMKDSGIEWIGEIPNGWNKDKVIRLFENIGSGTTPKSADENNYGGDINWIQSGDINGEYLISSKNKIFKSVLNNYSALKIYTAPFIVIAMYGASIGNMCISQIDACVNQACCVLSNTFLDFKFAFYAFKSTKDYLIQKGLGGGQPNINQDIIKQLWLPLPYKNEQKKIADYLDNKCSKIDEITAKIKITIDEYKKLKQSVITEAVTKGIRPDREMKDSGIEWIGKIPREWNIVKMKYLGKCRNGLTYSPDNIVTENGTLVLRSSNIKNGQLDFTDNVFVNCKIKPEFMVKNGDILICSRNGSRNLIGKNAIISKNLNASFGAFMMIFRCESSRYVKMILSSSLFSYYLGTFLTSTINQLTAENFNNMKVVYCDDIKEQQEITNYLDKRCTEIDAVIAKKEQLVTELENYKKSLIYEYVTGKMEVI